MQSLRDMLAAATSGGYALGYFEAWDQYSLEGVLEAAEEVRAPVILGFGGELMDQTWYDGGGLRRLAALGLAAAEDAKVPVCLLLNEVATFEQIERGLAWGFNAVMLDTSELPYAENVAATRRVVKAAHERGVEVEGEIDRLPDASGALGGTAGATMTDPELAARYVAETGVDLLSVSIGNTHIMTAGEAGIDLDLLSRLHAALTVPLTIHGGTGFPDIAVPRAIELGVVKFNVGTVLKLQFLEGIREALPGAGEPVDIQQVIGSRKAADLMQRGKERVKSEVRRRLAVYRERGEGVGAAA